MRAKIDHHLGNCGSHTLRTIIRNAVYTQFVARDYNTERKPNRELVMKLVVEACLDRLSQMQKLTPLQKHHPKIDSSALHHAFMQWLAEPAQKFVDAVGNKPDALDAEYGGLILGYKAFGPGLFARVLYDEFGDRGSSTDETMTEIARRGAALAEQAKNSRLDDLSRGDLYVTARIMRNAAWAYFLKREKMEGLKQGLPPAAAERRARKHLKVYSWEPKQDDTHWAKKYHDSRDPSCDAGDPLLDSSEDTHGVPANALVAPVTTIIHDDLLDVVKFQPTKMKPVQSVQQAAAPSGPQPQRAVPLSHLPALRTVELTDMPRRQNGLLYESGPGPQIATGEILPQFPQRTVVMQELPRPQRAESVEVTRFGTTDIAQAQLRMSQVSLGREELGRARLLQPAVPAAKDAVQPPDSDLLGEEAARAARVALHDRILAAAERSDIRALIDGLEALSAIGEREGVDAVFAALADALASRPEKTRRDFARLYDAIDTAAARLDNEGHPSYRAPRFLDHAEAIRNRLVESLGDAFQTSADEELIGAARQVLLALAEFDQQPAVVADAAQRSPFNTNREWVSAFIARLERTSEVVGSEGIDAAADALASQPAFVRENYIRLYDAIDTAMGTIYEDDPSYRAPPYFAVANALKIRLQDTLIVPGPDEELIEAARQVLLENAEMDELLAEFDRSPPLPRSPKALQDRDLGEGFDSDSARLTVSETKLEAVDLGSARLPGHDLHVIEKALIAIWYGDTESYLAALASLDQMDATTTPMAIQAVFLERDPATQERISKAAQILHERLIADAGTDAAMIRLSQQIVEIVKEVATPGRTIGIDTASEKPVESVVPPSANDVVPTSGPAWPVVRPRLKTARPKERAAISSPRPNTRPKRPPLVKREGQRLLNDAPLIAFGGAVRDVIDQGNVAEFLKALNALAELKSASERAPFHRAIKEAMAAKPPLQANVERLNRLMLGIFGHFNTAGMSDRDGLEQFVPIQFAWAKLNVDVPQLQVSPLGAVAKEDMTAALTFLTGLSAGRDASPAKSN